MAVWEEKFIKVNGYARSGKKMTSVRKIVIHYTANNGATAMNHYNYFNNLKGVYASAHFFVDKTDKLLIIPLNEIAYHANDVQQGTKSNPWRGVKELLPNANFLSVGIEMCLEKNGTFHEKTIEHAEEVATELCKRYKLDPMTDIVRHYDVTHKNCPAPWVKDSSQFTAFKKRVNERFKGTGVTPAKTSTTKPKVETTPAPTMPTLKKGMMNNSDVKRLQTRLNEHGYKVSVDGDFGSGTETAVKKFQKAKGLTQDGIVGKDTWNKLTEAPKKKSEPTIKKGSTDKTAIKECQKLLNTHGAKLDVDGIFGSGTETAVKKFQKDNKLTSDGIVGENTWKALKATPKSKTDTKVVKNNGVNDLNDGVYFRVIVGSFSASADARSRVAELKKKGIESFIAPYDASGSTLFRVVAGTFDARSNAEDMVAKLAKLKFDAFLLAMKK